MKISIRTIVFAALSLFVIGVHASGVPEDELKENGKGIIHDYSNMQEGDDIDWLWVAPGVKLSDYRYHVKSVKNLTMLVDDDLTKVLESNLGKQLNRAGSRDRNAPVLSVEVAVYWAERANRAKGWIPFAGMALAQAGVGVELMFTDKSGKLVAKIRHSAREGEHLADAGQETSDDIAEFIHEN